MRNPWLVLSFGLTLCLSFGGALAAAPTKDAALAAAPAYDAALAERLGADERGMRHYVLVILTTGPKQDLSKEERAKLFAGHMANIGRLADQGKLVLAGPMLEENPRHYEGIFIFDVPTVAEALPLLETDPAVAGGALAFEAYPWYASAAVRETLAIHRRIVKPSPAH